MDIYRYINSRDVAKHCREINKIWNPFEMAVIIGRSECTIRDKHSAWNQLMDGYPDMPTKENHLFKSYESFHEKLVELMDYEDKTVSIFMKLTPGAVYVYKARWNSDYSRGESAYTTYDKVLTAVKEDWERDEVSEIVISKIFPDGRGKIDVHCDYDGEVYSLSVFCDKQIKQEWYPQINIAESGEDDSLCLFSSQYLDMPMPFKRGDILTRASSLCDNNPIIFVLDGLDRDVTLPRLNRHDKRTISKEFVG